jgi:colanic acid biosynthesis glycosyl transferase WcaI
MKFNPMRILYLSQYFPPEAGATQTRAYEMARNLVRLGHAVTIIAEVPNHPSGIIPPEYRGKLVERSDLEGIAVIRVWVKASPVKSFRNRMLFYLTYMFNAILAGLLLARGHYNLIYASSPPLFVGGAALILSYIRRIPMLFEVRDLWPESAVALGELSNPRAVAWATRLEEACYQRACAIVVVTEGICERLLERGLPEDKIHLIPNGANVDLFHFDSQARERVRQELGLGEKFVVIYAGIHGVAQGLETLVDAARRLQHESQVHFLLVGDGPKKAELVDLVSQFKLGNLTLLDEQPRASIPALLSAADAAIIPLRKLEIFRGALPSKMFDSWACERPVLLSVDGEARQVMETAQAGIFIEPEDPDALAQAILELRDQPELRAQMGRSGRAFTEQHYSRQAQAEKLAGIMHAVLNSGKD